MRKRRGIPPLLGVLPILAAASVVHPEAIAQPELNITALGQLGVFGNFDTLTRFSYQGQQSVLGEPSPLDGIISQPDPLAFLASPLVDGNIAAACQFDGSKVIIAGNFTSILNQSVHGIASLNLASGQAQALGDENLTGRVNALYCNGSQIFVGGDFEILGKYGAAIWNNNERKWGPVPWGGFSKGSVVKAIASFGDNLVFAGKIGGIVNSFLTNSTQIEDGHQQLVPYSRATVTSSNGAPGQSDSVILCADGEGWKALDNGAVATLSIDLGLSVTAARVRVQNLANDGSNGTKTFRLISHPANGIMNLTYTDSNGTSNFCDAECPLELSSVSPYTDFTFVNQIDTNQVQFVMLQHYGDHAGLQSLQLFQDDVAISSAAQWNEPLSCQAAENAAAVKLTGSWNEAIQNQTGQQYAVAEIDTTAQMSQTNATFSPNLDSAAVYTVQLYTPGCLASSDCAKRGRVNVTVYPGDNQESQTTVLYQTNEQLKYDVVYSGPLTKEAYIELSPVLDDQLPISFVAGHVGLIWQGSVSSMNISNIFEYSPGNFTLASQSSSFNPVGSSFLNVLGTSLRANSTVNSLASTNDFLYIGGQLNSSSLVRVTDQDSVAALSLNGVGKLQSVNGSVFVTADGTYEIKDTALTKIYPDPANVAPFSYNGTDLWALSSDEGLVLYDPTSRSPYNGSISVNGHISYMFQEDDASFYIGSLQVQQSTGGGGATLDQNWAPAPLPYSFTSDSDDNVAHGAAYFNDSLSLVVGHFAANTSVSGIAHNAILVDSTQSSRLFADNELQDAEFLAVAANKTVAVLAGSAQGKLNGVDVNGVVLYNATTNSFVNISSLSGAVKVNTALFRPNTSQVILAGEIDDKRCQGICLYDVSTDKWSQATSSSLTTSILQADLLDQDTLLAALGNASFARISLHNGTASLVQGMPNITSFAISNSSTIIAGVSGNSSLGYWTENRWADISVPYDEAKSEISSVSILPTTAQNSSAPLASNELLVVFGQIFLPGFGTVSALTFDGNNWTPLFKASSTGNQSIVSKVSVQNGLKLNPAGYQASSEDNGAPASPDSSGPDGSNTGAVHHMARGRVVGISCAIAIGCVCLLILLGLLVSWIGTRSTRHQYSSMRVSEKDMTQAYTPEALRGIFSR